MLLQQCSTYHSEPSSYTQLTPKNLLSRESNITKMQSKECEFGICFDVDGVLAHGTLALPQAVKGMQLLTDEHKHAKVPFVFVTNSLNCDREKANQISSWFDVKVSPSQMVNAQGPLTMFQDFKHKHCLVLGQGKLQNIAQELGFTNFCTIEQVIEAYPLLDMSDYDKRQQTTQVLTNHHFPKVEVIILLGEPTRWESCLQVIMDLFLTDGKPDKPPDAIPEEHLPLVACNMDLQFKDRACMPRYGHGAFLACLETLYQKTTGSVLNYTSLVGKPSEITFRYAEHKLTTQAHKLGFKSPLKRMYLIGDAPEVDIVGSNLYQKYLDRLHARLNSQSPNMDAILKRNVEHYDPHLTDARNLPPEAELEESTVSECFGVLVCTGIYHHGWELEDHDDETQHSGHKDFPLSHELMTPNKICEDAHEAIQYILSKEGMLV